MGEGVGGLDEVIDVWVVAEELGGEATGSDGEGEIGAGEFEGCVEGGEVDAAAEGEAVFEDQDGLDFGWGLFLGGAE